MKNFYQKTLLAIFIFFLTIPAIAQVTTSGLNGKITDSKGEVLPGVVVLATHVPTGTKYPTMTDLNGYYHFANLTPGGPYTIKVTYIGQKDLIKENVYVTLAENLKLNLTMQENAQELQEVEVVVNSEDGKKGTSTKISKDQIQQLPTLSRSITDFTKLTPQSSNNSFAGTNFRYNNISVDGAVNNDVISFSPSYGGQGGTSNMPGSSTRSNPISLDAIQDMAVSIAPYDVRMGNFTGGSINAVTRRGTNNVEGSAYGFYRDRVFTGRDKAGDNSKVPSSYQDYQTGVRVGLPIIKDKLFFFTNFESTSRTEPLFYNAGDPGTFMTTAIAKQISDSLKSSTYMPTSQYSKGTFDPGASGAYNIYSKSIKFFARVDWNINDKNQLSIRNNYVPSSASNLERDANNFQFGNYDFIQHNVTNSTALELKSQINSKTSNQLILGYSNIHDYRDPMAQFPQMQINNVNGTGVVLVGANREASVFNQRSKTFEITDNFHWFKGKHDVTLGTHNEIYDISYGFINSYNGRIDYNNLTDFINKKPARFRAIYNLNNNDRDYNFNNPVAKYNVYLLSAYLQDEYNVLDNLKLTVGVRFDDNIIGAPPARTSSIAATDAGGNYGNTFTYTKFNQINNKAINATVLSPRFGFTWDIAKNKKYILRGGSGIFSGRIPFAWIGYAYYNNGVNYGAFDQKGFAAGSNVATDPTQFQAYNANVLNQPNRVEVDLIDNNFKMPRMWRSNLATDLMLPGGVKLTLEGIFTQTIYDVMFKQINLKDSVKYAPIDVNHQQPIYLSGGPTSNRVNNSFSSVYLMTNTTKGYRYQLTAQLSKEFKINPNHGANVMGAYTYGQSYDMANGIRNSFESNWQVNQSLNPNNPSLAYSNFDIRHRIISTLGWKGTWNKMLTTYLSFVFSGQSGSPYTYALIGNSLTKNGQQIDLFYVPKDQSEINFVQFTDASGNVHTTQQQWDDFNAYINNDKYLSTRRGKFTERNGARTPWNNRLDVRLMQDVNFYTAKGKKHTLQITFDILNLTNLINPKWGYAYFVNNTINQSVSTGLSSLGSFGANGNPNYQYTTPTTTPYSIDKLNSRWQGQLGLRYSF